MGDEDGPSVGERDDRPEADRIRILLGTGLAFDAACASIAARSISGSGAVRVNVPAAGS